MIKRGEVWWATLPAPNGSGPGYRRPVLVVQSNPFNASNIQTVIVAAITSNLRLADAPGNVRLARSSAGLSRPSVLNVSQVLTIDRARLTERAGTLAPKLMRAVDAGLRLVLNLA